MKTTNKIIIYDDSCPMCSAYTKAFVQAGLIQPSGRKSFSAVSSELLEKIDKHKCRNEIPLIDIPANRVKYGIDALLDILGDKWPFIKKIGQIKPANWFLKRLYNLVSFNRRVITASKFTNGNFDCTPDFNIKYRLLLLFIGLSFNTLMLVPAYRFVLSNSVLCKASLLQLQVSHFLFVLVNVGIAITLKGKRGLDFLGQANMLAILTTLFLLPLVFLNYLTQVSTVLNNTWLFLLLIFIVKEYRRRMVYAKVIPAEKSILAINILSAAGFLLYLSL